jgi:large subunit ribosomal protein L25
MEEFVLDAIRRDLIGKQVKALRREGKLPAILYGKTIKPTPVILDLKPASNTLSHMSTSALVTINLDDEKHIALVREKQRNVITGVLTHVDFQVVSMLEKIRTSVSIEVQGEAPAVKNFNGIVVLNTDELDVEALPGDLPERIKVDISILETIGQVIHLRDLTLPENIIIMNDPDTIIVVVTPPEVELAEEVEVAEVEPEVIEKGKKEEEEI